MFRITLLTAPRRLGTFVGAFLAFFCAAVLVMAGGMLLQAALSNHPPVERYAGATAVAAGDQSVGADNDVPLTERARVSSLLTGKLAALPGVKAAIADVAVPATVGRRSVEAHAWSSARLTPYVLTAGRAPAGPGEIVTGYAAKPGTRLVFSSSEGTRTATVVGTARPRHQVRDATVFLTDDEATRLAGHSGTVDAIGVIAGPGFKADRVRAAARPAVLLQGRDRGKAESSDSGEAHTRLIAVSASFAGVGIFVALFVVMGTMSLSIQQREQEIALLRAVAATPAQIRRMIAWEATLIALFGSAAGIWFGQKLGYELADGLVRHHIAPPDFAVEAGWLPISAVIGGSVLVALLAVLSAGRRASRVAPTRALAEAAVEPRGVGPGRIIGGLIAIASAVPLFSVASTTRNPATAAATSELTAIFLVTAVGFLGPVVARVVAGFLRPILSGISPVGGFLASSNLATQTRRFSSASTPIILTVAMSCTLLFSTSTIDHAVTHERDAGLQPDLVLSSTGPGLAPAALADVRGTAGVGSAVGVTSTSLGPSLGVGDETIPAQILAGGQGGGLDVDVTAGSLNALHGKAIALGERRADDAHAHVGDTVKVMLGDGTKTTAKVVATYKRSLGFGEALVAPELVAGHVASPLVGTILVKTANPAPVSKRLQALSARYPGLRVQDSAALKSADDLDRETNRWLGPLFVVMIFAFTSIAVVNTLVMIAVRRGRELALLRLSGATPRQVRSMARWEAALIVAIGLGVGLAIAATALLPLSHALTGNLKPYVPADQLGAILGISVVLALLALTIPTRRALRTPPIKAVGSVE
jgi:putative ABC transport system permease protein